MNAWTKADWRAYRNYLMGLACCVDVNTIEYKNLYRRIRWIWDNRL